jgi:hypothetical protein
LHFLDDPLAHMVTLDMNQPPVIAESRPRPETSAPNHNVEGFKLSVADLNRSPEDVFDIVTKVGEG